MKTEDFDRLMEVCEKEGFEFHVTDRNEDQASIIIQKKERVKVEIAYGFYSNKAEYIMVRPTFKVFGINKIIIEDAEKFLASKLEEYLNKE